MILEPLWNLWSSTPKYPTLTKDEITDVAIIGAGITGITTALLLKQRGYSVVVLEARDIGKGTTGQSTGNLYEITEDLYSPIISAYDEVTFGKIINARREAMELMKEMDAKYDLKSDFTKVPMYLFEDETTDHVTKEIKAAEKVGISLKNLNSTEVPISFENGFKLNGQYQYNPLKYIQGLAQQLPGDDCKIFENTCVAEITEDKENKEFVLQTGMAKVRAKYLVQATHSPKGKEMEYHSVLGPYREFGIAAKIKDKDLPEGIFWRYNENEKTSFRKYSRGQDDYLIAVGKQYKVGQAKSTKELVDNLQNFMNLNFNIEKGKYFWGGQNYKPADYLPYIGRIKDGSNQFVATGFAADGLVYGTMAAMIISEAIVGQESKFEHLFKASRHHIIKAAPRFVKENLNVAGQFFKTNTQKTNNLEDIKPGSAALVKKDNETLAVFRDQQGTHHAVSAVCTHMGCIVEWNDFERTWDCPCHGTRFTKFGKVIEGPALLDLKKVDAFSNKDE